MPRPPRPIDPSDGPVPRFASELRELRAAAGAPTYRVLAERTHFSKATLAAATAGYRLPTLDVTLAFVEACGGSAEEWRVRWQETRADLGLPVSADEGSAEDEDRALPAKQPQSRLIWIAAAVALAAVALVGTVLLTDNFGHEVASTPLQAPPDEPSSARFVPTGALSAQPIADGSDPKRTLCASDSNVTSLDSVEVNTPDEVFVGVIELRYAPQCKVAWGRFTPAEKTVRLTGAAILITVRRQHDMPTESPFEVGFDGQAVFGNVLLVRGGCVDATVVVTTALSGQAKATTACATGS